MIGLLGLEGDGAGSRFGNPPLICGGEARRDSCTRDASRCLASRPVVRAGTVAPWPVGLQSNARPTLYEVGPLSPRRERKGAPLGLSRFWRYTSPLKCSSRGRTPGRIGFTVSSLRSRHTERNCDFSGRTGVRLRCWTFNGTERQPSAGGQNSTRYAWASNTHRSAR